jgi:hypothetical protein
MKSIQTILSLVVLAGLIGLVGCNGGDGETEKDRVLKLLKKTWTYNSVVVPPQTATEGTDWVGFNVTFSDTNMTTGGHPTGATVIWPSGTFSLSDDGKRITRQDGVVMTITTLTENAFSVTFTMPAGTEISGRVQALDGDYTFNLK